MMKKRMARKVAMGVMCVIISAGMLMGCSGKSSTTEDAVVVEESVAEETGAPAGEKPDGEVPTEMGTEAPTEMGTDTPEGMEDAFMGEIASIDGDTITIDLYEVPEMGDSSQGGPGADGNAPTGEKPDGEAPTEMGTEAPTGEAPDGKTPGGAPGGKGQGPDGNAPQGEKPDGNGPQGEKPGENGGTPGFTLSGESMIINVTDTTVITSKDGDTETTLTLDDLAEGDTVTFTVDGEDALSIMVTPAQS